uniref:Uncharacterized protein n=1 Tax=Astyanax mexicanus TaxID=7994 RepID=A0A8B9HV73_ASTMX
MSQTTLLEEVVQWSPETCRQEVKVVLPKLVISSGALVFDNYSSCVVWEEHINVLRIIVDMFLPHLHLAELEEECFSKVLPKVVVIFTGFLEEISKQIGGLSSQNTELQAFLRNILQMMVQTLEALSGCVRHVCSFEEAVSLNSIRTLPSCVLQLLKDTFQHCKESELMYSGRLSLVGDLLQGLFKEAYSLQKSLMELLDKISLENSASREGISDIVAVIHSLLDICSVISSLDMALHANTWKFIIKQSMKYQSMVEEHLRHTDIASSLCEGLLASVCSSLELAEQVQRAGLQEAVQCAEFKLFQKTTKMCRFFANTLVHYIKEFKPFLSESCSRFHQMYLHILSKFPPSVSASSVPQGMGEELSAAVLVPMDAVLTQLLPLRPFAECVLAPAQSNTELALPQCLLLVDVLGKLSSEPEESLHLWCDGSQFSEEVPRLSVFEAMFLSFCRCRVERALPVRLPGVMLHGQAQGKVSLHQHVCVHLCGFVASLPAQHFPLLERSLFGAVLQSDIQTTLLATDVWCFLARYGTAELCLHHVLLTAHLIKSCPIEGFRLAHLGLLLRRLLFLMTPNHQMEFVERFSPSEEDNLCVWRLALLRSLCSEVRLRVEREVCFFIGMVFYLPHVLLFIPLNKNLLILFILFYFLPPLQAEYLGSSMKIIHQLWGRMCALQVRAHTSLQNTLSVLLSISAILIKNLEPHAIIQAFSCLSVLELQECPDYLVLAALEFLASMGKVFVPSDIQSQVLPRLSSLFSTLLACNSWLIRQHALKAFAIFAEVTNHEEVISQSLTSEETKNQVVNFLSKVSQEAEGVCVERLRAEASVMERHIESLEIEEKTPVDVSVDEEPCAKRPRQETSREEEYDRYLQTAESALKALLAVETPNTTSPWPQWVTNRLQALQTLISSHISTPSTDKT